MKATIDKLPIKEHIRWAEDQNQLDISRASDSSIATHFPEIFGTSIIYSSKLEELIALENRTTPWASFTAPAKYHLTAKRLFSYQLFPNINWKEEEANEDPEIPTNNLIHQIIALSPFKKQPTALFERDKTAILNLLDSITYINKMLIHINSRKLQYQKG